MFRMNLVVHHYEHGVIYCITQFGTIGTIVQASPAALKLLVRLLMDHNSSRNLKPCKLDADDDDDDDDDDEKIPSKLNLQSRDATGYKELSTTLQAEH